MVIKKKTSYNKLVAIDIGTKKHTNVFNASWIWNDSFSVQFVYLLGKRFDFFFVFLQLILKVCWMELQATIGSYLNRHDCFLIEVITSQTEFLIPGCTVLIWVVFHVLSILTRWPLTSNASLWQWWALWKAELQKGRKSRLRSLRRGSCIMDTSICGGLHRIP